VEVFLEGDILPIAFGRENLERMIDNSRRIRGLSAEVNLRGSPDDYRSSSRDDKRRQLGEHLHTCTEMDLAPLTKPTNEHK
jgi:hypothetical protein